MQTREIDLGAFSLLKPTVNFANEMTVDPGTTWGPRTISDCQLIYLVSGMLTLTIGGKLMTINTGECVFFGSNSPHKLVVSGNKPATFRSIHFDWHTKDPHPTHPLFGIEKCSIESLAAPERTYKMSIDEYGNMIFPKHFLMYNIESLFSQIVREYRFEEPGFPFILRGLLIQLLTVIIRHELSGNLSTGERRKIAPALKAIQMQPYIDWTVFELAEVCGYHPTYFAKIFKEIIGQSPKQYLISERIRKAKQLLLETQTVEEVSIKLGYTSIHYFSRNFKSITGLTPTEYKLQSLEL